MGVHHITKHYNTFVVHLIDTSKTLWATTYCTLCDTEIGKAATLIGTEELIMHHITKYHNTSDVHLEDT